MSLHWIPTDTWVLVRMREPCTGMMLRDLPTAPELGVLESGFSALRSQDHTVGFLFF